MQGFGGAIVMPLTLTLLASVVAPERRGVAFGVWGAMGGLGVALGPVIGGAIIAVLVLAVDLLGERADRPAAPAGADQGAGEPRRRRSTRPVGTALITLGLFGVVFGVVRGNGHGWTSGQVLTGLIGGGLLVIAFLLWERRASAPMVPLQPVPQPRLRADQHGRRSIMAFGMFGSVFIGAQFLQTVQHFTPLESGIRTLPWTAMPVLTAPIAGILSDRLGARRIVAFGLLLQTIGIAWLAAVIAAWTCRTRISCRRSCWPARAWGCSSRRSRG